VRGDFDNDALREEGIYLLKMLKVFPIRREFSLLQDDTDIFSIQICGAILNWILLLQRL